MNHFRPLIQSIVSDGYSSIRIDKYLAARFTYLSRTGWQAEIAGGKVLVNGGRMTSCRTIVKKGDVIEYEGMNLGEPDVDADFSILYDDDHITAINKTGNLPVHPSGIFFKNTLLYIIEEQKNMKFYPVHRLDRETSGVILFAKRPEIASDIQKKFHRVKKTYCAIVHGITPDECFTIDEPIGPDLKSRIMKKRAAYSEAKERSETIFEKITSFSGYTLVKAMPLTGRQHQIRVHLHYAGFPILGDKMYGLDENYYLEFVKNGYSEELIARLGFWRTALHARSIIFYHPALKKEIYIEADMPDDMTRFINDRVQHQNKENTACPSR